MQKNMTDRTPGSYDDFVATSARCAPKRSCSPG